MSSYNSGLHGNIYKTLCSWKNNDVDAFSYTVDQARKNVMEFCLCSGGGSNQQMTSSEIVKQSFILNLMDVTCNSILRLLFIFFYISLCTL